MDETKVFNHALVYCWSLWLYSSLSLIYLSIALIPLFHLSTNKWHPFRVFSSGFRLELLIRSFMSGQRVPTQFSHFKWAFPVQERVSLPSMYFMTMKWCQVRGNLVAIKGDTDKGIYSFHYPCIILNVKPWSVSSRESLWAAKANVKEGYHCDCHYMSNTP